MQQEQSGQGTIAGACRVTGHNYHCVKAGGQNFVLCTGCGHAMGVTLTIPPASAPSDPRLENVGKALLGLISIVLLLVILANFPPSAGGDSDPLPPLPKSYDSGWLPVHSLDNNDLVIHHDLGDFPRRVSILFSPTNPPTGTVYDVTSMGWYDNRHPHNAALHGGSIKLTKSNLTVGVWDGGFVGRHWSLADGWKVWKTGFYHVVVSL